MKPLAVLALACLAGCGTQQVLETGQPYAYPSAFTPLRLASCTAFNASRFSKYYTAHVERMVRPDNYRVVVTRIRHWNFYPIIVAHSSPSPAGSQLVVFMSAELPPASAEDWLERLRRGCDIEMRPAIVVPMAPSGVLPAEIPPAPRPLPASPLPQRRGTRG